MELNPQFQRQMEYLIEKQKSQFKDLGALQRQVKKQLKEQHQIQLEQLSSSSDVKAVKQSHKNEMEDLDQNHYSQSRRLTSLHQTMRDQLRLEVKLATPQLIDKMVIKQASQQLLHLYTLREPTSMYDFDKLPHSLVNNEAEILLSKQKKLIDNVKSQYKTQQAITQALAELQEIQDQLAPRPHFPQATEMQPQLAPPGPGKLLTRQQEVPSDQGTVQQASNNKWPQLNQDKMDTNVSGYNVAVLNESSRPHGVGVSDPGTGFALPSSTQPAQMPCAIRSSNTSTSKQSPPSSAIPDRQRHRSSSDSSDSCRLVMDL